MTIEMLNTHFIISFKSPDLFQHLAMIHHSGFYAMYNCKCNFNVITSLCVIHIDFIGAETMNDEITRKKRGVHSSAYQLLGPNYKKRRRIDSVLVFTAPSSMATDIK